MGLDGEHFVGLLRLSPLLGRECNSIKSYLFAMMKHFYLDRVVSSRMTQPPSTWQEDSLNELIKIKIM